MDHIKEIRDNEATISAFKWDLVVVEHGFENGDECFVGDGQVEEECADPGGWGGGALEFVGVAGEEGEEYCWRWDVSLCIWNGSLSLCLRIGNVLSDKLSRAPRIRTRSETAS